jgi:hypothetical protein
MNEQTLSQKELLYCPKNWAFLAFFLSPILPAILYYRNSKLLNTNSKGKIVLIGSVLFVLLLFITSSFLSYYSDLIILAGAIVAVVISKILAKTQLPYYEKMKEERGLKGGRNEFPLVLLFTVIVIGLVIFYIAS